MAMQEIANAIERMRGVFARRPQPGMSEDSAALAVTRAIDASVDANGN